MAEISPFSFMQEVRSETDKVTWPTRRETLITTGMVFVMVAWRRLLPSGRSVIRFA
jgi:preprotein translocase subunit SecE